MPARKEVKLFTKICIFVITFLLRPSLENRATECVVLVPYIRIYLHEYSLKPLSMVFFFSLFLGNLGTVGIIIFLKGEKKMNDYSSRSFLLVVIAPLRVGWFPSETENEVLKRQ